MTNSNTVRVEQPKKNIAYGFFLWATISMAYLLFVANWGFTVGLNGDGKGTSGVLSYFQIDKNDPSFLLMNTATNWGITLGRGIGSVLVAVLLSKLFHKYTAIIALSLTLFGIPAQWLPGNAVGYGFFLAFRTLMAIGGTMLIILTQPVVSNYFNKKQKSVVSQFGIWFYPLGTIITILPLVIIAKNNLDNFKNQWQIIFTVIAALNVIPLVILCLSKFGVKTRADFEAERNNPNREKPFKILGQYLKKKETYFWTLLFGGWLVAVVLPTSQPLRLFPALLGDSGNIGKYAFEIRIWMILFLAAVFVGPITVGLWSKYKLKRKGFVAAMIGLGILFFIISMLIFVYGVGKEKNIVGLVFFYIFGFLTGLVLWGIQGVILNMPHEYKDSNPKSVGWLFSLIWGLGYIFYTLVLIVISSLPLMGLSIKTYPTEWAITSFVLIIVFSSISLIGAMLLKEPSEDAQTCPNWMKKIFKRK